MIKKYYPSTRLEDAIFQQKFCEKCKKYHWFNICSIVENVILYDINDEKYPKEWQLGPDGQPICIAFEPIK